ncbi:TniB family NTP-binding protein [Agarivorans sp. DSG3-1]|uniref:TniB family NTP-binding protein n=1 Tax=Agarivorans sp. DSG3-1 TaxID=3342249 RepID=UPI00398EE4DB
MTVDTEERDKFLARVIWYPRFKQAYDTLVHCLRWGGNDAEALLLSGPVGTGKSYLLQQLERDFPTTETDEQTFRPVLYASIPPENTLSGLLGELLAAMGDPMPTRCKIVDRRLRLKQLVTQQKTRMIALDESQNVVPRTGADDKSANIKLLRELIDDLTIPIVFAGKDAVSLIAADDALRSRVRCKLSLDYFTCRTAEDALDFADYLEGLLNFFPRKLHGFNFINELPEGDISLSDNINNLVRIVLVTEGSPRTLRYLLREVIETTQADEVVTTEHFKKALSMANNLDIPLRFNPFDVAFSKVKKEAEKRGLYDSDAY